MDTTQVSGWTVSLTITEGFSGPAVGVSGGCLIHYKIFSSICCLSTRCQECSILQCNRETYQMTFLKVPREDGHVDTAIIMPAVS